MRMKVMLKSENCAIKKNRYNYTFFSLNKGSCKKDVMTDVIREATTYVIKTGQQKL